MGSYENQNEPVGNIRHQSIDEIWNGKPFQKMREGMASGDFKDGLRFTVKADSVAINAKPIPWMGRLTSPAVKSILTYPRVKAYVNRRIKHAVGRLAKWSHWGKEQLKRGE